MAFYPFKLSYVTKSRIWGGTHLKQEWGKNSDSPTIGESWELTVRKNENSVILNGEYAGRTLQSILAESKINLIAPDYSGKEFPLLVKLIDAGDRLSVQVHPDDDYAGKVENDRGKTEMWYIVDAKPDAEIICGLRDGVSITEFASAVRSGNPESVLNHIKVRSGETYFIPAGLPHAIGKGILIAEIQQNCDLTYRVYDYNRRQPDGSLRELHVEKALDVIRPFSKDEILSLQYARRSDTLANGKTLVDCCYFRVEQLLVNGTHKLPPFDSMRHLLCLNGNAVLIYNGEEYPVSKGDSYFLPPMAESCIKGTLSALVTAV